MIDANNKADKGTHLSNMPACIADGGNTIGNVEILLLCIRYITISIFKYCECKLASRVLD